MSAGGLFTTCSCSRAPASSPSARNLSADPVRTAAYQVSAP